MKRFEILKKNIMDLSSSVKIFVVNKSTNNDK